MKKKTNEGIEYFTTMEEAEAHIDAYAKRIEEQLTAHDMKAIIEIAINKELGIDQAERAVLASRQVRMENARRAERRAESKDTYEALAKDYTEGGTLAAALLRQSFEAYVGGARVNIGIGGGPYSLDDVDDAIAVWETLGAEKDTTGVEFWAYRCQDKAAAGKANVGGTLATRGFQANFLSKWSGVTINAHVDLNVAACP